MGLEGPKTAVGSVSKQTSAAKGVTESTNLKEAGKTSSTSTTDLFPGY